MLKNVGILILVCFVLSTGFNCNCATAENSTTSQSAGASIQLKRDVLGFPSDKPYVEMNPQTAVKSYWWLRDKIHRLIYSDDKESKTRTCRFETLDASGSGWRQEQESIGGVNQKVTLYFVDDNVSSDPGHSYKLENIVSRFNSSDYSNVLNPIKFKYGEGTTKESELKNKDGEKQVVTDWTIGKIQISLKKYADENLSDSELQYTQTDLLKIRNNALNSSQSHSHEARSKDY